MQTVGIGVSVPRKESQDKVTGIAKYNTDYLSPKLLYAWLVTSLYAHAEIKSIDTSEALQVSGVQAVITGNSYNLLCGSIIEDRPPLAKEKVRYFGEPLAVVIANREAEAKEAAGKVKVEYNPLPVVNSPSAALATGAPLLHEKLAFYKRVKPSEIFPLPGTNIAQHIKIRKGDLEKGWQQSEVIVESSFSLPQSNHIAMEPRNAIAEIKPDGKVIIHTSTQAPFDVQKMLSLYFKLDETQVIVHTPLVGGGFGGKTAVQLEIIAYLASQAVAGRPVKLVASREQDMTSSPGHLGLDAQVKVGATKAGIIKAMEITYQVDIGAYVDSGSQMTRAISADCTGPYKIDHVWCDAYSVYTNHTYVTAFRGFGRLSYVFAIERTLDKLAFALGMDPFELRLKNALTPDATTPTMVRLNKSNLGDLPACLTKIKDLINWDEGVRREIGPKVIAKGISCLWKTSSSPPNAGSGAIITINVDGTLNLNVGTVEIGSGSKTSLAQILAEKLKMDVSKINVVMEVNTEISPKHWKTVASMTNFMVGNAVLDAAEDLVHQLTNIAGIVLRCPPEVLEVGGGRVYLKEDPDIYIEIKEIGNGYQYPGGNSIGGQIIGRGNFIMQHIVNMDKDTGKGRLGPAWAVGAQAVEVAFDPVNYTYQILKAATVIDAGKVLNPKGARGVIIGGMCMGLGYGSREHCLYGAGGKRENPQLRTYHLMRFGENPTYLVDFVETPHIIAPYGLRGIAEHGIIGIPAALANALSAAAQVELNQTPLTPEAIWRAKKGVSQ
ncbi:xanthine dehydrogenase family protein molybdopterin-binding subunit [Desulfotomaculum sp. 1211_IL3151]|uniref:xanthine dehydrogenase family protein molybdopterin-binding subunit n=1 Tax=Desulfotomaculum sp. 1211_IL3151 TaxID=3084055 RepID=UPI002FD97106